jgi:hypothetical protein
MPFSPTEIENIAAQTINFHMDKGKVHAQAVQNKPMSQAFDEHAGTFAGGTGIDLNVKVGGAGGTLQGYKGDDQVSYYNPATAKRVTYAWDNMHLGISITHDELRHGGITVMENGAEQSTSAKSGQEKIALANLLDEKIEDFEEDYAASLDALIHGDGTSDVNAISGIGAFILEDPSAGSTGGLSRVNNTFWRNRAATAAAASAGSGDAAIVSSAADGGAAIQYFQKESRQRNRYARGSLKTRHFAGSDFIDAIEREFRANGSYTQSGWKGGKADTGMPTVTIGNQVVEYDPTLDDMGFAKRLYTIDMRRIKLLYMDGEKKKKSNPARPYDRYTMYHGLTTSGAMVAQQLNTSGVYDIA